MITGDVLFKHNVALHVLHEFRIHTVEQNPELISSVMTLARLDSWIMTSAECMTMNKGFVYFGAVTCVSEPSCTF